MISSGVQSNPIVEVFKVPRGMTALQFEQKLRLDHEPLVFDAQAPTADFNKFLNFQTLIVSDNRVVLIYTDTLTASDCDMLSKAILCGGNS